MEFIIDQYSLASPPPYAQPPLAAPFLSAFPYQLFGGQWPWPWPWPFVHILYTEAHLPPGVDPDPNNPLPPPTLRYQDGTQTLSFSGNQITAETTTIGMLRTVTLTHTVDVGDTLFSLLLPGANEPGPGQPIAISALGITTRVTGPISVPPPQQAMQYSTMYLHGMLSTSVLPPGPG
jgi:hypothetical protein